MKKLAFISDLLFTFLMAFLLSAVLFRSMRTSLPAALLLSALCGVLAALSVGAFLHSRRKHEFLKKSEERTKEKLLLHLALADDDSNVELIKALLQSQAPEGQVKRTGKNRLTTETELYFLHFSFAPVTADEVAGAARVKTNRKKILLCCRAEEQAFLLCKRLHIEVQRGEDLFLRLQEANVLPEKFLGEEETPPKRAFKLWFSRKNSRRFLVSAALVLSLSWLTPFSLYYLIFASLLLLAALFTRIFGKE